LFLGAGSVIHGCHHDQDIRKMGGLRRFMPVTFLTYAVGMMALSGVPLFFSGGWTKEEILHATADWPRSHVPYHLVLAGIILTAPACKIAIVRPRPIRSSTCSLRCFVSSKTKCG